MATFDVLRHTDIAFQALHPGHHGSIEFTVLVSFDVVFSKNLAATVQGNRKRCILASDTLYTILRVPEGAHEQEGSPKLNHVDLCLRGIEEEEL